MVTTDYLDALREKFRFGEWPGESDDGGKIDLHDITLPEGLLPGLGPERVRVIRLDDDTVLLRASWGTPDKGDTMLLLDIRECPTREMAQEVLLQLLGNMQSPEIERFEKDAPGEIAFATPNATTMIFTRGNLAVSLANGGPDLIPVAPMARALDAWFGELGGAANLA